MTKTIIKVYTFTSIKEIVEKYYVKKSNRIEDGGFKPSIEYDDDQLEIESVDVTFEEMCEDVKRNIYDIAECRNILARVEEWELGYCGQKLRTKFFRYIHEELRFEEVEVD